MNTIGALRDLKPEFINIPAICEHPDTVYAKMIQKDVDKGKNRRLSSDETALQMAEMIAGIDFPTTLGCFDNSMFFQADTNLIKFHSVEHRSKESAKRLAARIERAVQKQERRVDVKNLDRRCWD
jgi:hypothetical protein